MSEYKPATGTADIKHVIRTCIIFIVVAVACLVVASVALDNSTQWIPNDPGKLKRFVDERWIRVVLGLFIWFGMQEYIQIRTQGQLLKGVLHDPKACAAWHWADALVFALLYVFG